MNWDHSYIKQAGRWVGGGQATRTVTYQQTNMTNVTGDVTQCCYKPIRPIITYEVRIAAGKIIPNGIMCEVGE